MNKNLRDLLSFVACAAFIIMAWVVLWPFA